MQDKRDDINEQNVSSDMPNDMPNDTFSASTPEQDMTKEDDIGVANTESIDYEAKYNELNNEYMRVFADFENVKKRLEREKFQALEYANESFSKDLLPILDSLDRALEIAKGDESEKGIAVCEGLGLVKDNFTKMLAKHGVERIPTDVEFDPNIHECLMQIPCEDKKDGEIVQVMQVGFKYKDRVLRPSMVGVAKNN